MQSKYLLLGLALLFTFTACDGSKQARLKAENASLAAERAEMDSLLNGYLHFVNEIEANLDLIEAREGRLANQNLRDPEYTEDKREQILRDIQFINTLMEQNREQVEALERASRQYGDRLHEMNKLTKKLQKDILARDEQIAGLKEELKHYFEQVVNLEEEVSFLDDQLAETTMTLMLKEELIDQQLETISNQKMLIERAWYVTGSYKELAAQSIVTRKGGVLGVGAVEQMVAAPDQNAFEQINVMQTSVIPLKAKKVELVTSHPEDSYHFHKQEGSKRFTSLEITDPVRFWQQSKYLVVMTN